MRLGLIGLGRIGSFHASTLAALPAVESLIVADLDPARAKATADRLGAELADTPEQLIEAGVDGVVIAAATDAHPQLITAAVEAGRPVFCEKPLAADAAAAVALQQLVRSRGAVVQIGYPRRFDAGFAAARAAAACGQLGWVHTIRSTTLDPAPPPRDYVARSGGLFRDCSVHDFDAVRWATGREVTEVYAAGRAHGDPCFAELGDVASASVLLTLDDGATAVVSNSRYNPRGYDVRLELHGTADSVVAGWDDHVPVRNVEPGAWFPAGPPCPSFADRLAAAFRAELAAFTEVVAGRLPSPCTVDDAVAVTWIAEAATVSCREHRPVRIDEIRLGEVRL
jgi:myo-inositol 2-dehydrogenase/D-chiro-inositol 1-dehydrogenase